MDGLTISNSQKFLDTGEPLKNIQAQEIHSSAHQHQPDSLAGGQASKSFSATLDDMIQSVNKFQVEADRGMQQLATGQNENLHDVMIAAEKADIALRLMMQVRNKMIEAYHEVMKMQV